MTDFLTYFLPSYFVIYFGITFVLKTVVIARRIGKNPLVLPKDDSAYGLIGFYFKLTLLILFLYTFTFAIFPAWHDYFLPIWQLEHDTIISIGLIILILSFLWTVLAQRHMKTSWRIGIDTDTSTELVTTGLFSISRNPIFFGMIGTLTGLFLVTPNAITAFFLIVGYILIQIQIRLEEEFLAKEHGKIYLDYQKRVRRLI